MRSNITRAALLLGVLALTTIPPATGAQARPDVPGRIWGEFGVAAGHHDGPCSTCAMRGSLGGPALTASAGLTLDHGLGLAFAARVFQSFSFEYSRSSKYALALGQYTLPGAPAITLNAGGGYGTHGGDGVPSINAGSRNQSGAVALLGVAARVLPRSRGALAVTADLVQSISGAYRPRLLTIGIALNVSSGEPR